MTRRRLTASVLSGVLAVGLAACGDSQDSGTGDRSVYEPTESPSMAVTMIDLPADYSTIEGAGFSIGVPGEFQQKRTQSSNGEPMLVLEKPSEVESLPQRVAIIRDVDPKAPASEQSFALETSKAAAGPEAEAERSTVPSGDDDLEPAYLVTWKETRPSADDRVEVTYWQLLQQVDDDLIINVVALAPSAEFDTSEVSKILRTFVVDASSPA
ncbi:hypothetical protein [Nocardioides sp. zg-DK7169]|uniref:hypothetical protein n=1 Tax=Nocardioides sp. zg-DK7169 TaxID=2736600 RepID=UPI001555E975|nr:hypothetical protein [Nocardioides sp. zg-DK7169]NPC95268.1 hypothetical protein [Nocardioides sp. zg-DK7169]